MRRVFVLAVALLAIGCSSHSSLPVPVVPVNISPQIFQRHLFDGGWVPTGIPNINSKNAKPWGLVAGPKNSEWVADAGGAISAISMGQNVKTFPLVVQPTSIAVGSDQNLWVASPSGYTAKVTPLGVETDYDVAPGVGLSNITPGPDGALWFAECSPDRSTGGIGTITTSGTYTLYNVGCQDVLASGPDGNIWYGDGALVANMTTQGVVIGQYPVGDSNFVGMAAGSDGALYVTGPAGSAQTLTRVSTQGAVTQLGTDMTGDALGYLTSAPDDNLWISTNAPPSNYLVTFDPLSQSFVGRFHAPGRGPIATGPDGNIWLGDTKTNVETYVRLVISASPNRLTKFPREMPKIKVTESNYSGSWTAESSDPSIATITHDSINGMFYADMKKIGTCKFSIRDMMLNSIRIPVTVH